MRVAEVRSLAAAEDCPRFISSPAIIIIRSLSLSCHLLSEGRRSSSLSVLPFIHPRSTNRLSFTHDDEGGLMAGWFEFTEAIIEAGVCIDARRRVRGDLSPPPLVRWDKTYSLIIIIQVLWWLLVFSVDIHTSHEIHRWSRKAKSHWFKILGE